MAGESLEDALAWNLGRYTLHGEIAAGGMATVHIGRLQGTAGFSKMVAIKRLHAQFAKDPDFVAMFLDEARLAARVHHPNVVSPLDVIATDGEVFLVMEYIRGESLSKIARILRPSGARMPLKIAGAVMVGVLHGLHAAHEATDERAMKLGIVHRDVSPQNVLVGTDGIARVLDFGIAKAADTAHMTREGDLKGKLAYMAPEQLTAESEVDRRTDIYAASIVLWELLTGQRLFDADYSSAILARAKNTHTKAPSEMVGDLPKALDDVVLKGLARKPEDRFTTAREMAIQLEMVMPLATPSKVGEWLEEIARESLTKRAARIAEIELLKSPESASAQAKGVLEELAIDQKSKAEARAKATAEATRSWKSTESKGFAEERSMSRVDSAPMIPTGSIYVVEPEDVPGSLQLAQATGPLPPPNPPPHSPRSPQSMRAAPVQPPPMTVMGIGPLPTTLEAPASRKAASGHVVPAPPPSRSAFPPGVRPPTASARPGHEGLPMRQPSAPSWATQPSLGIVPPPASSGALSTVNERPSSLRGPDVASSNEVAALPRQLLPPTVSQFELPAIAPQIPFEMPGGGGTVDLSGKSRKKSGGSLTAVLLFLVAAVGIFALLLPMIVKRGYVSAAAARGITLRVDDVDLSLHRIRLRGVTATIAEMPGVYVHAGELGFNVRDEAPEIMDAANVDVTIDGPYPNVRDGMNRYLAMHPLKEGGNQKMGGIQKIDVRKGHLIWSRVVGDTSKVDLEDISGAIERVEDRSLGEDFQFVSNLITIGTPAGPIGPWRGTLAHSPASNTVKVALGPGNAEPGLVTVVDSDNGALTVDIKVPRSTTEKLGVTKTMAGLAIDETLQLEGTFHYARTNANKVESQAAFALYGLKLAGAQVPIDARFQARVAGEPSAPMEIQDGVMVFGTFKARIFGKITALRDAVRFDVVWKTNARPCTQAMLPDPSANIPALAWDPVALEKLINVAPTATQTQVGGTFVFDSRDLAQTRFSAAPSNKCGLKIFGP